MKQTPSQTVGPYFAYSLTPRQYHYPFEQMVDHQLVDPTNSNQDLITISGRIFDGDGNTIPDAIIEVWQNEDGKELFGRYGTGTDAQHSYVFTTTKPLAYDDQAPHLSVIIMMRGQLIHSYTRIYFEDEAELNKKDTVLNLVPEDRRNTLIAKKISTGYIFDIHMQGDHETVFFDI
jgi:protocatechuate 3,4-dioxygenase, alpha subunit